MPNSRRLVRISLMRQPAIFIDCLQGAALLSRKSQTRERFLQMRQSQRNSAKLFGKCQEASLLRFVQLQRGLNMSFNRKPKN